IPMNPWNISGTGTTTDLLFIKERLRVAQEALATRDAQLLEVQGHLVDARQRAAELFHSAPVAYLTCGWDGLIHEVNSAATRLLNCELDAILGAEIERFI